MEIPQVPGTEQKALARVKHLGDEMAIGRTNKCDGCERYCHCSRQQGNSSPPTSLERRACERIVFNSSARPELRRNNLQRNEPWFVSGRAGQKARAAELFAQQPVLAVNTQTIPLSRLRRTTSMTTISTPKILCRATSASHKHSGSSLS